jgi:hypothetical protein
LCQTHCGRFLLPAGTETLQLWDWLLATDDCVPGGDVAAADLTEARQTAAAAASTAAAAGSRAAGMLAQVRKRVCCMHMTAVTASLAGFLH